MRESRNLQEFFFTLDTNVGVGIVARGLGGNRRQGSCDPRPVLASSRDTPDALENMLRHFFSFN